MASATESCHKEPNFAVICSFLEKYGELLGLPNISFLDLKCFLENETSVARPLIDLHVSLLKRIGQPSVNHERFERSISKFCFYFSDRDGWEVERFGYKHVQMSTKLRVLKNLLECQFDYNFKFKEKVNEMQSIDMRLQPAGRDRDGMTYWYLMDKEFNMYVYREEVGDDKTGESWELLCHDRNQLEILVDHLQNNTQKCFHLQDEFAKSGHYPDDLKLSCKEFGSDFPCHQGCGDGSDKSDNGVAAQESPSSLDTPKPFSNAGEPSYSSAKLEPIKSLNSQSLSKAVLMGDPCDDASLIGLKHGPADSEILASSAAGCGLLQGTVTDVYGSGDTASHVCEIKTVEIPSDARLVVGGIDDDVERPAAMDSMCSKDLHTACVIGNADATRDGVSETSSLHAEIHVSFSCLSSGSRLCAQFLAGKRTLCTQPSLSAEGDVPCLPGQSNHPKDGNGSNHTAVSDLCDSAGVNVRSGASKALVNFLRCSTARCYVSNTGCIASTSMSGRFTGRLATPRTRLGDESDVLEPDCAGESDGRPLPLFPSVARCDSQAESGLAGIGQSIAGDAVLTEEEKVLIAEQSDAAGVLSGEEENTPPVSLIGTLGVAAENKDCCVFAGQADFVDVLPGNECDEMVVNDANPPDDLCEQEAHLEKTDAVELMLGKEVKPVCADKTDFPLDDLVIVEQAGVAIDAPCTTVDSSLIVERDDERDDSLKEETNSIFVGLTPTCDVSREIECTQAFLKHADVVVRQPKRENRLPLAEQIDSLGIPPDAQSSMLSRHSDEMCVPRETESHSVFTEHKHAIGKSQEKGGNAMVGGHSGAVGVLCVDNKTVFVVKNEIASCPQKADSETDNLGSMETGDDRCEGESGNTTVEEVSAACVQQRMEGKIATSGHCTTTTTTQDVLQEADGTSGIMARIEVMSCTHNDGGDVVTVDNAVSVEDTLTVVNRQMIRRKADWLDVDFAQSSYDIVEPKRNVVDVDFERNAEKVAEKIISVDDIERDVGDMVQKVMTSVDDVEKVLSVDKYANHLIGETIYAPIVNEGGERIFEREIPLAPIDTKENDTSNVCGCGIIRDEDNGAVQMSRIPVNGTLADGRESTEESISTKWPYPAVGCRKPTNLGQTMLDSLVRHGHGCKADDVFQEAPPLESVIPLVGDLPNDDHCEKSRVAGQLEHELQPLKQRVITDVYNIYSVDPVAKSVLENLCQSVERDCDGKRTNPLNVMDTICIKHTNSSNTITCAVSCGPGVNGGILEQTDAASGVVDTAVTVVSHVKNAIRRKNSRRKTPRRKSRRHVAKSCKATDAGKKSAVTGHCSDAGEVGERKTGLTVVIKNVRSLHGGAVHSGDSANRSSTHPVVHQEDDVKGCGKACASKAQGSLHTEDCVDKRVDDFSVRCSAEASEQHFDKSMALGTAGSRPFRKCLRRVDVKPGASLSGGTMDSLSSTVVADCDDVTASMSGSQTWAHSNKQLTNLVTRGPIGGVGGQQSVNRGAAFPSDRSHSSTVKARGISLAACDTGTSLHGSRPKQVSTEIRCFSKRRVSMPVDKKTEICGPLTMRRSTRLQVMQMSKQPEVDRDSGGGGHKGNVSSEDTLSLHQESEEDDDFTPQLGHSRGRPSATIRRLGEREVTVVSRCSICDKGSYPDIVLFCNKCTMGFHMTCLRPPVLSVPDGDWFCPPCEHTKLIDKLTEHLRDLEANWKKKIRLTKRKERLAFVGINLDNILKEEVKPLHAPSESKSLMENECNEKVNINSNDEESENEPAVFRRRRGCHANRYKVRAKRRHKLFDHLDVGDFPSEAEVTKRTCRARQSVNYQFKEYDDLINNAIEQDLSLPRTPRPCGGHGQKDLSKLYSTGKEEQEDRVCEGGVSVVKRRGKDMSNILGVNSDVEEGCSGEGDDGQAGAVAAARRCGRPPSHSLRRKARRRLTLLNSDDDDENDDDSDEYKLSDNDGDSDMSLELSDDDYSDDSVENWHPGKPGHRKVIGRKVQRKSFNWSRHTDEDYIISDDDDSEEPARSRRPRRKVTARKPLRRNWELDTDTDMLSDDTEVSVSEDSVCGVGFAAGRRRRTSSYVGRHSTCSASGSEYRVKPSRRFRKRRVISSGSDDDGMIPVPSGPSQPTQRNRPRRRKSMIVKSDEEDDSATDVDGGIFDVRDRAASEVVVDSLCRDGDGSVQVDDYDEDTDIEGASCIVDRKEKVVGNMLSETVGEESLDACSADLDTGVSGRCAVVYESCKAFQHGDDGNSVTHAGVESECAEAAVTLDARAPSAVSTSQVSAGAGTGCRNVPIVCNDDVSNDDVSNAICNPNCCSTDMKDEMLDFSGSLMKVRKVMRMVNNKKGNCVGIAGKTDSTLAASCENLNRCSVPNMSVTSSTRLSRSIPNFLNIGDENVNEPSSVDVMLSPRAVDSFTNEESRCQLLSPHPRIPQFPFPGLSDQHRKLNPMLTTRFGGRVPSDIPSKFLYDPYSVPTARYPLHVPHFQRLRGGDKFFSHAMPLRVSEPEIGEPYIFRNNEQVRPRYSISGGVMFPSGCRVKDEGSRWPVYNQSTLPSSDQGWNAHTVTSQDRFSAPFYVQHPSLYPYSSTKDYPVPCFRPMHAHIQGMHNQTQFSTHVTGTGFMPTTTADGKFLHPYLGKEGCRYNASPLADLCHSFGNPLHIAEGPHTSRWGMQIPVDKRCLMHNQKEFSTSSNENVQYSKGIQFEKSGRDSFLLNENKKIDDGRMQSIFAKEEGQDSSITKLQCLFDHVEPAHKYPADLSQISSSNGNNLKDVQMPSCSIIQGERYSKSWSSMKTTHSNCLTGRNCASKECCAETDRQTHQQTTPYSRGCDLGSVCANPEQVCANSEQLCSEPEKVCTNPQQDHSNAENVCSKPEVGFNPEQICSNPEQVCTNQEQLCSKPQHVCAITEQVCTDPEEVCFDRDQAYIKVEVVCSNPEQVSSKPQRFRAITEQVCTNPEQVCANQEQACTNPDQVYTNPEQVCANPEQVCVNPEQVYANHEQIPANPEKVCANPEQVCTSPELVCVNPEQMYANSEHMPSLSEQDKISSNTNQFLSPDVPESSLHSTSYVVVSNDNVQRPSITVSISLKEENVDIKGHKQLQSTYGNLPQIRGHQCQHSPSSLPKTLQAVFSSAGQKQFQLNPEQTSVGLETCPKLYEPGTNKVGNGNSLKFINSQQKEVIISTCNQDFCTTQCIGSDGWKDTSDTMSASKISSNNIAIHSTIYHAQHANFLSTHSGVSSGNDGPPPFASDQCIRSPFSMRCDVEKQHRPDMNYTRLPLGNHVTTTQLVDLSVQVKSAAKGLQASDTYSMKQWTESSMPLRQASETCFRESDNMHCSEFVSPNSSCGDSNQEFQVTPVDSHVTPDDSQVAPVDSQVASVDFQPSCCPQYAKAPSRSVHGIPDSPRPSCWARFTTADSCITQSVSASIQYTHGENPIVPFSHQVQPTPAHFNRKLSFQDTPVHVAINLSSKLSQIDSQNPLSQLDCASASPCVDDHMAYRTVCPDSLPIGSGLISRIFTGNRCNPVQHSHPLKAARFAHHHDNRLSAHTTTAPAPIPFNCSTVRTWSPPAHVGSLPVDISQPLNLKSLSQSDQAKERTFFGHMAHCSDDEGSAKETRRVLRTEAQPDNADDSCQDSSALEGEQNPTSKQHCEDKGNMSSCDVDGGSASIENNVIIENEMVDDDGNLDCKDHSEIIPEMEASESRYESISNAMKAEVENTISSQAKSSDPACKHLPVKHEEERLSSSAELSLDETDASNIHESRPIGDAPETGASQSVGECASAIFHKSHSVDRVHKHPLTDSAPGVNAVVKLSQRTASGGTPTALCEDSSTADIYSSSMDDDSVVLRTLPSTRHVDVTRPISIHSEAFKAVTQRKCDTSVDDETNDVNIAKCCKTSDASDLSTSCEFASEHSSTSTSPVQEQTNHKYHLSPSKPDVVSSVVSLQHPRDGAADTLALRGRPCPDMASNNSGNNIDIATQHVAENAGLLNLESRHTHPSRQCYSVSKSSGLRPFDDMRNDAQKGIFDIAVKPITTNNDLEEFLPLPLHPECKDVRFANQETKETLLVDGKGKCFPGSMNMQNAIISSNVVLSGDVEYNRGIMDGTLMSKVDSSTSSGWSGTSICGLPGHASRVLPDFIERSSLRGHSHRLGISERRAAFPVDVPMRRFPIQVSRGEHVRYFCPDQGYKYHHSYNPSFPVVEGRVSNDGCGAYKPVSTSNHIHDTSACCQANDTLRYSSTPQCYGDTLSSDGRRFTIDSLLGGHGEDFRTCAGYNTRVPEALPHGSPVPGLDSTLKASLYHGVQCRQSAPIQKLSPFQSLQTLSQQRVRNYAVSLLTDQREPEDCDESSIIDYVMTDDYFRQHMKPQQ